MGLNILLVADSAFWITGRTAVAIRNALGGGGHRVLLCSHAALPGFIGSRWAGLFQPDLVHFLTPRLSTIYRSEFWSKAAFVSSIHHVEDEASTEPIAYSDAIMTVSDQWHSYLLERFSTQDRLVKLPNGIDVELFQPGTSAERVALRKAFGISPESFVIGFSAKRTSDSSNRKGIDVLEAVIKANLPLKGITWFIRGPGWNEFVSKLRESGASIVYEPYVVDDEDLAKSYRVLDLLLVTSKIEGGPVPVLEAMASGIPVVSTPVGVVPEVLSGDLARFIVPYDDIAAVVEKISHLYHHRQDSNATRIEVRKRIVDNFQWHHVTRSLPKLYAIAEENFLRRTDHAVPIGQKQAPTPRDMAKVQRWVDALECIQFARFLHAEGASAASRQFARRGLVLGLGDLNLVGEALTLTWAAPYIFLAQRVRRKVTAFMSRGKHP